MIHSIGLGALPSAFLSTGLVTQVLIASTMLTFIVWMVDHANTELSDDAAVPIPSGRIAACSPFFRRRLDFLRWGFKVTGQRIIRFTLWRYNVVALSGEAGRQFFFSTRGFNLNQGHQYLNGSIPLIPGVTSNIPPKKVHLIYKNIVLLQKDPALQQDIPIILKDVSRILEGWSPAGSFNPHDKVTEIIFQITLRTLACDELADNPTAISKLRQLFDELDYSTTPWAVLMPWFPSPALVRKYFATNKIFNIISDAVKIREEGGVAKRVDTLQILMEMGESRTLVVGFMMGLVVAGARATGISASWLLTYLAHDAHWRNLARKEVHDLLTIHTSFDPKSSMSLNSISELLSEIPLASWENSAPVLDKLIRETLRLAQPHTAMRKNMGPDVYFDGKVVPSGTYAVYSFSDVHLDENLYPDPWKFNPDRPEPKAAMGYIGWGGGKNICQGTRLAKLELKLVMSMFLAGYDFEAIDRAGKAVMTAPRPDWNDNLTCRPEGGPVEVRYKCN